MLFRQNIDQRAIAKSRETIKDVPSNAGWTTYLQAITDSGSSKNMYVYSKSFTSDKRLLHLGRIETGSSDLVANLYGPVDAGKFGQYWGMVAQGVSNVKTTEKKRLWTHGHSLGSNVVSLVAREYTSGGKTNALHIGYGFVENSTAQLKSQILWNQTIEDGNSGRNPGEIIYGSFSSKSSKQIMVKYFEGLKGDSRMEFWSLPANMREPPSMLGSPLNTTKLK